MNPLNHIPKTQVPVSNSDYYLVYHTKWSILRTTHPRKMTRATKAQTIHTKNQACMYVCLVSLMQLRTSLAVATYLAE
ncbi:hypothetical protein BDQ94DRAFT_139181 [Aspergillus welwitschiae]|uniref:Uncharacterized protein n=1 Tax=Aspergillus welwitschiae TaxID=1341132 RepID=A0A3F3Q9C5_9EURO|nr:hypothetical protein BDQ94DRAFT_139181 [Aspergillus welwitschiae]RDH35753.1 hypothetical protein BDQ94DRAFT_139181 [Aspergillus welwitschiae]